VALSKTKDKHNFEVLSFGGYCIANLKWYRVILQEPIELDHSEFFNEKSPNPNHK
jgi:hypothetical protein